jgi:hypothetical protein
MSSTIDELGRRDRRDFSRLPWTYQERPSADCTLAASNDAIVPRSLRRQ